jgi:hypothetical protein
MAGLWNWKPLDIVNLNDARRETSQKNEKKEMNESVMNFNSKKVKTDYKTREKTVSITLTSTKHMLRID